MWDDAAATHLLPTYQNFLMQMDPAVGQEATIWAWRCIGGMDDVGAAGPDLANIPEDENEHAWGAALASESGDE